MALMQHGKSPSELAWNEEGERYDLPDNAVGFKVRRFTGKPGKPPAVWVNQGILHLPLDATMDDLRLGVSNEPGSYRLYPVDDTGRELSPPAYVEVVPDDRPKKSDKLTPAANGLAESTRSAEVAHAFTPDIAGRFFDLHERMLTSRDAHDALMANLLTTLVTTTAQIQQSTARLLGAANTTIKIANGVEAIERAPVQIDADALAAHITESMAEDDQDKPQGSLIAQLINGPLGMSAIQLLQGFSTSLAATQKAKFAAEAAAQAAAAQQRADQAAAQQRAAQQRAEEMEEDQEEEDQETAPEPPKPSQRVVQARVIIRRPWPRRAAARIAIEPSSQLSRPEATAAATSHETGAPGASTYPADASARAATSAPPIEPKQLGPAEAKDGQPPAVIEPMPVIEDGPPGSESRPICADIRTDDDRARHGPPADTHGRAPGAQDAAEDERS